MVLQHHATSLKNAYVAYVQEEWKKETLISLHKMTGNVQKEKFEMSQWYFWGLEFFVVLFFCTRAWRGWCNCRCDLEKLTWGSSGAIPKSSMCKESICVLFSQDHASKLDARERKSCSTMLHWRQQGYSRRKEAWY